MNRKKHGNTPYRNPDESELIKHNGFQMTAEHLRRLKNIYNRKHYDDDTRDLSEFTGEEKERVLRKEFPKHLIGELKEGESFMRKSLNVPEGYCLQKELHTLLGVPRYHVTTLIRKKYIHADDNGYYNIEKCRNKCAEYGKMKQQQNISPQAENKPKTKPEETPVVHVVADPVVPPAESVQNTKTDNVPNSALLKELLDKIDAGNAVITNIARTYTITIDVND
jgi:hypothetical protein